MATKTVEEFFSGKSLVIPGYQRDCVWNERNLDDLFGDIGKAVETNQNRYLGTFILSQKSRAEPVYVVDGHQRLTTLTMLLDALISVVNDEGVRQHYRNMFISNPVPADDLVRTA